MSNGRFTSFRSLSRPVRQTRDTGGCVFHLVFYLGVAVVALMHTWVANAETLPDHAMFRDTSGIAICKAVTTFKELKERRVVKQRYDYSCGAAALATLLQHYYKLPVSEESIVNYIIKRRGADEAVKRYVEKQGFSLLDLKQAAGSIQFKVKAYAEMSVKDLEELNAPVIVPIRLRGYDHFVVYRGLDDDGRVYVTDPVAGNLTMKKTIFESVWRDGVGMMLVAPDGRQPADWRPKHNEQGFYVSGSQLRAILYRSVAIPLSRYAREF